MKKLMTLIIAAVLTLSLAACGNGGDDPSGNNDNSLITPSAIPGVDDPVSTGSDPAEASAIPVQLGDSIENDYFCMTFDSVELVPEYSFSTGDLSTVSLYVEDGYQLVILKGHFENRSTSAISSSSFVSTAVVNGTYVVDGFDVEFDFLRNKLFEIDPYTDLDYVIHINIPEKLADMFETVTFTIGFNDDMSIPSTVFDTEGTSTLDADNLFELTSGISTNPESDPTGTQTADGNAKPISIGETVTTNDYEFTLTNVELTYEVLPPNTSGPYASYPADSGKVFVHVEADVKNTMQRDIRIEDLFTCSVVYDGKYPYAGFTVVNDGNNRFDWLGSYVAATPLETCQAHGIIECPVEVDTSGKPVVVHIDLGDTVYEYALR